MSVFESASWLDFRKFLGDSFDSQDSLDTLKDAAAPIEDAPSQARSLSRTSMSQQNVYERIVLFLSTAFQEMPSKEVDITEIVSRLAETLQPALSTLRAPVTDRLSHSFFFSQLAGLLSDPSIAPNSKLLTEVLESQIGHHFWNLARTRIAPYIHIQSGALAANLLVLRAVIDDALSSVPNESETIQSFAVYVPKDETGPWNNIRSPRSLRKREFELIIWRVPSLEGRDVMDMDQLRGMITNDEATSIKPIMIVGRLGTSVTGDSDDLEALLQIKKEFDVWLHLEGALTSNYLFVDKPPGDPTVDSCSVDIRSWSSQLDVPNLTFFLGDPRWLPTETLTDETARPDCYIEPESNEVDVYDQHFGEDILCDQTDIKGALLLWSWVQRNPAPMFRARLVKANDTRHYILTHTKKSGYLMPLYDIGYGQSHQLCLKFESKTLPSNINTVQTRHLNNKATKHIYTSLNGMHGLDVRFGSVYGTNFINLSVQDIMSKGALEDVLCQLDTATNVAESIFQHSTTLETEVLLHNELQYSSLQQVSDFEDLNAKISPEGLQFGAVRFLPGILAMALSKYPEVQSDIVDLNSFIADSLNTRHVSSRFEVDRIKGFILIGATKKPYNKESVVNLVQEILDLGTERVQKNQMPQLAKVIQKSIKVAERQLEYEPSLKIIEQIPLFGHAITAVLDTLSGDDFLSPESYHKFNLLN